MGRLIKKMKIKRNDNLNTTTSTMDEYRILAGSRKNDERRTLMTSSGTLSRIDLRMLHEEMKKNGSDPKKRKVVQIETGSDTTMVLLDDGKLLVFGDQRVRRLVRQFNKHRSIVHFARRPQQLMIVTDIGECFGYGKNKYGQLGLNKPYEYIQQFTKCNLKYPVTNVACSYGHSIAWNSKTGKAFSCGSDLSGQLGRAVNNDWRVFVDVNFGNEETFVSEVYCGSHHSIFVTDEKKLFSVGCNDKGQCGQGHYNDIRQLSFIPDSEYGGCKAFRLALGDEHSIVLNEKYEVYVCGGPAYWNGLGYIPNRFTHVELKCSPYHPIKHIAAGPCGSIFISEGGIQGWISGDWDLFHMVGRGTSAERKDFVEIPKCVMDELHYNPRSEQLVPILGVDNMFIFIHSAPPDPIVLNFQHSRRDFSDVDLVILTA